VATLPAATGKRDLGQASAAKKPSINLADKPKVTSKAGGVTKAAPKNVTKPKKTAVPKSAQKVSKTKKAPAYKPSSGSRSKQASSRGSKSMKRR
jgi:hypothetical protein